MSWIKENFVVSELTGYDQEELIKDKHTATEILWSGNEQNKNMPDIYFLKTSQLLMDEVMVWNIHNTICEI